MPPSCTHCRNVVCYLLLSLLVAPWALSPHSCWCCHHWCCYSTLIKINITWRSKKEKASGICEMSIRCLTQGYSNLNNKTPGCVASPYYKGGKWGSARFMCLLFHSLHVVEGDEAALEVLDLTVSHQVHETWSGHVHGTAHFSCRNMEETWRKRHLSYRCVGIIDCFLILETVKLFSYIVFFEKGKEDDKEERETQPIKHILQVGRQLCFFFF